MSSILFGFTEYEAHIYEWAVESLTNIVRFIDFEHEYYKSRIDLARRIRYHLSALYTCDIFSLCGQVCISLFSDGQPDLLCQ